MSTKMVLPSSRNLSHGLSSASDAIILRCVGVWDTVGALGLPDEIIIKNPKNKLFGFNDPGKLGAHIQYAFQALALDERRKDFVSMVNAVAYLMADRGDRIATNSSKPRQVGKRAKF